MKNPPPAPSLVFVDLNMPVKNGFDVNKDIRSSKNFKDIPIIVLSTSSDSASVSKSESLGANYCIQKPS